MEPSGRPHWGVQSMTNVPKHSRVSTVVLAVFSLLSLVAAAQEKKEFRYTVGPKAVISITNDYGPISVKPSGSSQVVVGTVSRSDAVSLVGVGVRRPANAAAPAS